MIQPFAAKSAGKIRKMDAETIGRVSLLLGGGRQTANDTIDFAVGVSGIKKIGERVEKGEPLSMVHARSGHAFSEVTLLLEKGIEVG